MAPDWDLKVFGTWNPRYKTFEVRELNSDIFQILKQLIKNVQNFWIQYRANHFSCSMISFQLMIWDLAKTNKGPFSSMWLFQINMNHNLCLEFIGPNEFTYIRCSKLVRFRCICWIYLGVLQKLNDKLCFNLENHKIIFNYFIYDHNLWSISFSKSLKSSFPNWFNKWMLMPAAGARRRPLIYGKVIHFPDILFRLTAFKLMDRSWLSWVSFPEIGNCCQGSPIQFSNLGEIHRVNSHGTSKQ